MLNGWHTLYYYKYGTLPWKKPEILRNAFDATGGSEISSEEKKKKKTERREISKLRRERKQAERMWDKGFPNLKLSHTYAHGDKLWSKAKSNRNEHQMLTIKQHWEHNKGAEETSWRKRHYKTFPTLKQENKLIQTVTLFTWKRL